MNIIKTTGLGAMLIFLCSFCTEFPKEYEPVQPDNSKYLNVVAGVSETEIPVRIDDNYDLELFGNVASCNLAQSNAPCIWVSGMISQPDANSNFKFENGEMLLESTTENCKLWGQFSGQGFMEGDRFTINADVEVSCGTGLFKSSGGHLTMTITGLLPKDDKQKSIYELILYGHLEI